MNISSLNILARESGLPIIAALGAQRILAHVADGGFLGANADHYALGIQGRDGRVAKSGYDCFTEAERSAAFNLAEIAMPSLWDIAENNFRNACREAEKVEIENDFTPSWERDPYYGGVAYRSNFGATVYGDYPTDSCEPTCDCWTASNVPGAVFASSDAAMDAALDAAFPRTA